MRRIIMHRLGEQWTKSVMNGVPVRAPGERFAVLRERESRFEGLRCVRVCFKRKGLRNAFGCEQKNSSTFPKRERLKARVFCQVEPTVLL